MKVITKFKIVGFSVLAWGVAVRAQSDTAEEAKSADLPGLLGRTTLSLEAGALHLRNEAQNPTGPAFGFNTNLPIDDGFDYHLSFGYDRASKSLLKVDDLIAENNVTYYYRTRALTPFLSAGFGYDRAHVTVGGVKEPNNSVFYDAATGIEVPISKVSAVRLGVAYDQNFKKPHARALGYDLSTNYWFSDGVGASLGASLRQGRNGAHDSVLYLAGVNFSFD